MTRSAASVPLTEMGNARRMASDFAAYMAAVAEGEFNKRLPFAQRAADARTWPKHQANAKAREWLAIACAAGATPPQLRGALDELLAVEDLGEACARRILADELADRTDWIAELERAVRTINERDPGSQRAQNLTHLAIWLLGTSAAPTLTAPREAPQLEQAA